MKTVKLFLIALISVHSFNALSQKYGSEPAEKYGQTLNLGAGISDLGYYHPGPALLLNYEFGIARNVTLAPFVGFDMYTNSYYWGDNVNPYRNYVYRDISIPVGVKGAYYFDELFHAGEKWDFYAALSLGFSFHTIVWENGYNGDRNVISETTPLYLAGHIGSRYNFNKKVSIFLDLSSAISTFGVSFKFNR